MATGTRERHGGGGRDRELGGTDSFANFALHLKLGIRKEPVRKRPAYKFSLGVTFCMATCEIISDATDLWPVLRREVTGLSK